MKGINKRRKYRPYKRMNQEEIDLILWRKNGIKKNSKGIRKKFILNSISIKKKNENV